MYDLLIENVHIVNDDMQMYGTVAVKDGKTVAVMSDAKDVCAKKRINGNGRYLLPGGVDAHVHIRYPGGEHRENFYTGTCAAAAGGTTTIIEHPISTPPQYSPEILLKRVEAFAKQGIVDAAFLGAVGGDHLSEIVSLGQSGIVGFKTFLHEPPEGREKEFEGLCCCDSLELYRAMELVEKTGLLMAAHTEDNELVMGRIKELRKEGKTFPLAHCLSRPPMAEILAVQKLLTIAKVTGTRIYLVHISTPQAIELAIDAKMKGQEVYIETCPQYLYMDETWMDRFGAYVKCNPALRDREMVNQMWHYIEDGTIDVVSSDHAPYTIEEKEQNPRDIFAVPAGFPGLETRAGFVFKAVKDGRISLQRAVALLSGNPAKIFGLKNKGRIEIGYDADYILLDPYAEYSLNADTMFTMAKGICHFLDGVVVSGRPQTVFLRGEIIFNDTKVTVAPGYGKWIGSD